MSQISHSIQFSGGVCYRLSKASRREDLQVEEPVACWDFSSFDFHPTLSGMLSAPLVGHQVVQVREPCQKCLLTATWVMKRLHGEQFPLDGIMGLIQQGAGHGHLGVGEDRIPALCSAEIHPSRHLTILSSRSYGWRSSSPLRYVMIPAAGAKIAWTSPVLIVRIKAKQRTVASGYAS